MIQICRETAELLRDYIGAVAGYEEVAIQAAFAELNAALEKPTPDCCGGCEGPCA